MKIRRIIAIMLIMVIIGLTMAPIAYATNQNIKENSKNEIEIQQKQTQKQIEQGKQNILSESETVIEETKKNQEKERLEEKEEQEEQQVLDNEEEVEEKRQEISNTTKAHQTQDNISTFSNLQTREITYEGTFDIDSPNPYQPYNEVKETTLIINGWYLSNDVKASMKVFIDEQEMDMTQLKREARPDVLMAVKGYGGAQMNPEPGFRVTIDLSKIKNKFHTITYQLVDRNGKELASKQVELKITKGEFYIDTPSESQSTFDSNKIKIEGWLLATDPNASMKIWMDGKDTNTAIEKRIQRPDVLNAIKGYGGITNTPKPGFSMTLDFSGCSTGVHKIEYVLVASDGEEIARKASQIIINDTQKGTFDIDTPNPYRGTVKIKESQILVQGWIMANQENVTLKIYLNGKLATSHLSRRIQRPDVLNAIKGYEGSLVNPTPGFEMTIDTKDYKSGNYEIRYELQTENGKILAQKTANITIQKAEIEIDNPNPYLKYTTIKEATLSVNGWYLSSDKESKMKVWIDNQEIDTSKLKRVARPDVLSTISGYEGSKLNPLPGFTLEVDLLSYATGYHEITCQILDNKEEEIARKTTTIFLTKGEFYIDKPTKKQSTFYGDVLKIEGWKLSYDKSATVNLYIDGEKAEVISHKTTARPDVLNAIKGYGGSNTNPYPGFEIEIDITKYTLGKHILQYTFETDKGEELAKETKEIMIYNQEEGMLYLEYPSQKDIEYGVSRLHGWEMSTYSDSVVDIKIDGIKVPAKIERFERPDVIKAIKNYGGIETNPMPEFSSYIDFTQYTLGEHTLEVTLTSKTGKQLNKIKQVINIYKNITNGIDVSEFNGIINWVNVKQSQDFAMIRVGYRGYRNPVLKEDAQFYKNIQSAQTVGMKCGIYFMSQAINEQEAIEEANWVVNMVSRYNITYPIAFDSEWSNGNHDGRADYLDKWQRTKIAKAFLNTIRARGYIPALYASKNWLYEQLEINQLNDYDIWVAHYTGDINQKTDYQGAYTMWQYTSQGWINGVNGNVDRNICYKRYV